MRWAPETPLQRFWRKVNKDGPIHPTLGTRCWVWLAAADKHGYGRFWPRHGSWIYAHRFAYEASLGSATGLHVLHRCDNPPCVNPTHLFLGTQKANLQDMADKGRRGARCRGITHCKYGHPLSGENLSVGTQKGGRLISRVCKTCSAEKARRFRARKKAVA